MKIFNFGSKFFGESTIFAINVKRITRNELNTDRSNDLTGTALLDYLAGTTNRKLKVFSSIAETDEIPVRYFFRTYDEMPLIEQKALQLCRGRILDVGAAAGCHSLELQRAGKEVLPVDTSAGAVEAMHQRGLKAARQADFFNLGDETFDTLLLLMNGIGICGTLDRLDDFFIKAASLLEPGGQILVDSSDILYMHEQDDGSVMIDLNSGYYGEVEYRFGYGRRKGAAFNWLFVDFDLLADYAGRHGFSCELVLEGEHFDYLARIL